MPCAYIVWWDNKECKSRIHLIYNLYCGETGSCTSKT
jgi:hypothetical protein